MRGGRTRSALAVVATALGCAPPGPRQPLERTEALRRSVPVASLGIELSALVAGDPAGTRVILVHGTPGSADAWADYLLTPPTGLELVALDRRDSAAAGRPRR